MKNPKVAIVMGSDSDLPVVTQACQTFDEFEVAYDVSILSAHRTPEDTVAYVKHMEQEGVCVYIAAAGGAAHLPGVVAAYTHVPVIGIPIATKTLQGVDSLYSIVQMPPGVPVATVGINAAKNASLLAIQILAIHDPQLKKKLSAYKITLMEGVREKNTALHKNGWKQYGNK